MIDLSTTAVFLTEEEVKQFVTFQKHRALIGVLESINAFDIRNGSITINFDHLGQIKAVDKRENFHL